MSDHTVYNRLVNAAHRASVEVRDIEYLRMLPDLEKRSLIKDHDYRPPLHWLVGICDEIEADLHYVLYGDKMLLTPPLNPAMIETARDLNRAAEADDWPWRTRTTVWNAQLEAAARTAGAVDFKRLTFSHWRDVGAAFSGGEDSVDSLHHEAELDITPVLRVCERDYRLPFVGSSCPNCGSSEYVVILL